jgi:hypothetical protein
MIAIANSVSLLAELKTIPRRCKQNRFRDPNF